MRGKDLLECVEQIDDALVEEALEPAAFSHRKNKLANLIRHSESSRTGGAAHGKIMAVRWGMAAACVAVLGISAAAFWSHRNTAKVHMEDPDHDIADTRMAMDTTTANDTGAADNPAAGAQPDTVTAGAVESERGGGGAVAESAEAVSVKENAVESTKAEDLDALQVDDYAVRSYEKVQNFAYELFAQNISSQNPVLSPVSAYLALSMAGCAADGSTADEFFNVLGDMDVFADDMMSNIPQNGDRLKLSLANSAWIDDEFVVDTQWLDTISSLMYAEAFQADLSTEDTMNSMNSWISEQTNGMIDKMIEVPLDAMARLVLFDTVYFKGKWETPFKVQDTHTEDFYVDKQQNEKEQVEMMNLYMAYLDCISTDFAEGVILPYQNNPDENFEQHQSIEYQDPQLAFIALKPKENEDVRDLCSQLTSENIKTMLLNRQNEMVHLKLPKFEVTFEKELNESLRDMGLTECFDIEKANFGKMGTTKSGDNLYISLVRQKAKIIVNEEGTEAAAVTMIDLRDGGGSTVDPKELFFNEPFLYIIMDMERELPLFIGILDDPKEE